MWIFVLGFFMFLSAVLPWFSLVLYPRGRLGGLRGKVWIADEEFEDNEGAILVSVSESFGAGSPGLSRIKGR